MARDSASGSHTAIEFGGLSETRLGCCRADIGEIVLHLRMVAKHSLKVRGERAENARQINRNGDREKYKSVFFWILTRPKTHLSTALYKQNTSGRAHN